MDFTYVDPKVLVLDRVYQQLRTYHEAGLVDPIDWAEQLRQGLEQIGVEAGDSLTSTLPIYNGKVRIPLGVTQIQEVYLGDKPLYPLDYHKRPHESYEQKGAFLILPEREGVVTLTYRGSPEPDSLPVVPNDPLITDFLVKKLIYSQVHTWYLNGEVQNLERILQLVQSEYVAALDEGSTYVKLPSFSDIYRYKRNRPKWNHRF